MTKYQSILPSTALSIDDDFREFDHTVDKKPWSSRRRHVLISVCFVLGIFGVAAFFVLSSSSTLRTNESSSSMEPTSTKKDDSQSSPSFPEILPVMTVKSSSIEQQVEEWEEWKEELVQEARLFFISGAPEEDLTLNFMLQDWWSASQEDVQQWWKGVSHWWNNESSKAQQWSNKDAEDTKEWASEESEAAGEWVKGAENKTRQWLEDEGNATGVWINGVKDKTGLWISEDTKPTGEWATGAKDKTGQWLNEEGQATVEWAKGVENKTGQWAGEESNGVKDKTVKWVAEETKATGRWVKDAENKTGQWVGEKTKATEDWLDTEKSKMSEDAQKAEHAVGGASQKAEHAVGGASHQAEHAVGDAAQTATHWVGDEAQTTGHWVGDEATATGQWFRKGGNTTKEWFQEESSTMEHWIRDEARATSEWFKKEENVTAQWLHKEDKATQHFFEHETNVAKHWFQQDASDVKDWWHNITHRPARSADENLIYLNSTAAFTLLANGYGWYDFSRDFFTMQQGWDVQENQAYCAVATSATILNSLRGMVDLPVDASYKPYPYATQDSLFNECTDRHVVVHNTTFDGVFAAPGGLTLDQAAGLLQCHLPSDGWTVESRHVDPSNVTLDDMRKDLVIALMSPAARVLINYNRAEANQVGGGHFSPIGSYSHAKDAFLVMDVAKYKYPAVWVPSAVLYRSLGTVDACGTWDFPDAQVKMMSSSHRDLLHPSTPEDYVKAFQKLGCQAAFRGYVVVKQVEVEEEEKQS